MSGGKTRKKNFTANETDRIIQLVEENYRTISSKFSDQVTLKRKTEIWKEICRKINAISPCLRTADEIKKRWDDIKTRAKRKANEDRARDGKTGNVPRSPPSDTLTETDRRVIGMMGVAQVFGISNRDEYDTAVLQSKEKEPKSKRSRPSATATGFDSEESVDVFDEMQELPTQTLEYPSDDRDEDFEIAPPKQTSQRSSTSSKPVKKSVNEMLLEIESQRLDVDKQRLQVEEKTLATLEQLVDIEKKKLELMTSQQSMSNAPKPRANIPAITESLFQKFGKKGVFKP